MIVSRQDAKSLFTAEGGVIDAVYSIRDAGENAPYRFCLSSVYDGREQIMVGFQTEGEGVYALDQMQAHFQAAPRSAARSAVSCIGNISQVVRAESALIRLGYNSWGVLRFGEIRAVYVVSQSRSQSGWWDVAFIVDGVTTPLSTFPKQSEALERLSFVIAELRRSLEPQPTNGVSASVMLASVTAWLKSSRRKLLIVPALACVGALALYGASHLFFGGASRSMSAPPALPPSVFQGMMADQNDDADNAISMLRQKIEAAHNRSGASRSVPTAKPEALKEGYAVTPRIPIAIPGMGATSDVGKEALQGQETAAPNSADIESMQKKLSILSGVDNTAPLPGSDIGNYRDMQKVLPDISAGKN